MQYPNLTEYLKAIRYAEDNLDKLSSLRPVMDSHNEPFRNVGGFAVVFKMKDVDTGRLFAIKCFHEEQENRAKAYGEISKTLRNNKSPYLMEVNYLEKELYVDTKVSSEKEFPVLQMDWIEGETMETYIASHYRDTDAIFDLYQRFCDLALWLRTKPFAHGDIKPDNIMIRENGTLTLVDYDGMYVPSMAGTKSPTIGTRSFSHPQRTPDDFDEAIDDFALASMAISLLAMSQDTSLYQKFGAPDRLLFSYEDYLDLGNTPVFKKLNSLGGLFPKLLELFSKCAESNLKSNTPLYDQIFDLQTKAPEINIFECNQGDTVYVDDEIQLFWKTVNATKLILNGVDVTDIPNFKKKITETTEFELIASNGLKESSSKISITVLPKPTIKFKASKTKLRVGRENSVRFTWTVKNSKEVILKQGCTETPVLSEDSSVLKFDSPTDVRLVVIGLDGQRKFEKLIKVYLFNESSVEFKSDKLYSLPGVPITLSWSVEHSKDVELEGIGKVNKFGSLIVAPKETTTYILKVTDAFGTQEHELKVQMLPIPTLNINVPTPEFTNTVDVNLQIPTPTYSPSFPDVKVMGVEFKAPTVPSLTETGIDVKLSERLEKQINLWADLKNLYTYYRNKLLSHEQR